VDLLSVIKRSVDRRFLALVLSLAVPISLQQVLSSSFQLVDVIMINRLGEATVGAVALSTRLFIILSLVFAAMGSGVAIFCAQSWGKGDRTTIERVIGAGLLIALGVVFPVTAAALLAPEALMGLLSEDAVVVETGGRFLQITAVGYPFAAVTMVLAGASRSVGRVKLPLAASFLGIALNTVLNYALIFGHLGLPAWGAEGAAVATATAKVVECSLLIAGLYLSQSPAAVPWRALFRIPRPLFKRFFGATWPLIVNEFLWSFGLFMYFAVYARMGTEPLATMSRMAPVEYICIDLFVGFGSAAAILIGREIGAGNRAVARDYALRFSILGPLAAGAVGLCLFFFSGRILSLFDASTSSSMADARRVIYVIAAALWFKVFNLIACVGVLRSGGDTRFLLFVNVGAIWLIGIPLASLAGLVLQLPVYVVYIFVLSDEFAKFFVLGRRVLSFRWLNSLVEEPAAAAVGADEEGEQAGVRVKAAAGAPEAP
jgi:putative MATE family efflux protein